MLEINFSKNPRIQRAKPIEKSATRDDASMMIRDNDLTLRDVPRCLKHFHTTRRSAF